MQTVTCPPLQHFHVVFEQVGNFSRPNKTVISQSPADALDDFLKLLPPLSHSYLIHTPGLTDR